MSVVTDQLGTRLRDLYDAACFGDDQAALDQGAREVAAAEAELALARGRFLHAQFLRDRQDRPEQLDQLTHAAEQFHDLGDRRGEGEALFWAAIYHQVVRDDETTAISLLEQAEELTDAAGDRLVMSYVVRHLGFVDVNAGRLDRARARFEESVRLRREIGFRPGVAAGLVALAELSVMTGDRAAAENYLQEASTICQETHATAAMRWISQVRQEHDLS